MTAPDKPWRSPRALEHWRAPRHIGCGNTADRFQPKRRIESERIGNYAIVDCRDDKGTLVHRRFNGMDWFEWFDLGVQRRTRRSLLYTGVDRVDAFVQGNDGQLWQISRTDDLWSGWIALGGALGGPPRRFLVGGALQGACPRSGHIAGQRVLDRGIRQGWTFATPDLQATPIGQAISKPRDRAGYHIALPRPQSGAGVRAAFPHCLRLRERPPRLHWQSRGMISRASLKMASVNQRERGPASADWSASKCGWLTPLAVDLSVPDHFNIQPSIRCRTTLISL